MPNVLISHKIITFALIYLTTKKNKFLIFREKATVMATAINGTSPFIIIFINKRLRPTRERVLPGVAYCLQLSKSALTKTAMTTVING